VKRGIVYDNALGDAMLITIVATGFRMQPFEEPFKDKGPVIVLDEDPLSGKETIPSGGTKEGRWGNHGASGIEVVEGRRVFENDSPAPAPVTKIKPKPALIADDRDMNELEVPAYIRRKVAINAPDDSYNAPASTLTSTPTGGHRLSSDNPYLHQHMD
jgi:hypothetical protein